MIFNINQSIIIKLNDARKHSVRGQDTQRHYEHVLFLNVEKRIFMFSMYIKRNLEQSQTF